MMSAMVWPFWFVLESSVIVRPVALMTPVVNVPDNPYGEPTATTGSPTCKVSELASVSGVKLLGKGDMERTAKSALGSEPSTLAG